MHTLEKIHGDALAVFAGDLFAAANAGEALALAGAGGGAGPEEAASKAAQKLADDVLAVLVSLLPVAPAEGGGGGAGGAPAPATTALLPPRAAAAAAAAEAAEAARVTLDARDVPLRVGDRAIARYWNGAAQQTWVHAEVTSTGDRRGRACGLRFDDGDTAHGVPREYVVRDATLAPDGRDEGGAMAAVGDALQCRCPGNKVTSSWEDCSVTRVLREEVPGASSRVFFSLQFVRLRHGAQGGNPPRPAPLPAAPNRPPPPSPSPHPPKHTRARAHHHASGKEGERPQR
jgi:hypothetical protein